MTEMIHVAVRVADLLKLPALKLAHTRAGVRGLSREVEYMDVLESPDMEVLIKPRVLYLTSGFAFHDNPRLQENLISRLQETGAAGLIFEQGRYLTPLPVCMVEAAENLRFPIIELPQGIVFADVIRQGLEMIFMEQGAALRQSQRIQKALTEAAVSTGSLQQIAQTLANLVGNTVIIADRTFSLLSFAFWEKEHKNQKRKAYLGNALDQYLYNLEKTGFIDKIRQEKKAGRVEVLFSSQGEQAWVVVPVLISGEILGYLAVLEDYHRLKEAEWAALEQASTVTAVAIYKQVAEEEVLLRQRNDFLISILKGHLPIESRVLEQAARMKLALDSNWVVLQMEFINFEEYCSSHFALEPREGEEMKTKLLGMISAQVAAKHKDLVVAAHQEHMTMLCPAKNWQAREEILQQVKKIRQEIERISPDLRSAVGISRLCESYGKLPQAYREARETLAIGRKLGDQEEVYFYADLGVYQILMNFKNMPEMAEYYQSILGKLDALDAATRNDLFKTLDAYFSANANIYKAAQNLYLHRNTMKYRLDRIKDILGVDLDEPEVRFNVQFALKIRHLL